MPNEKSCGAVVFTTENGKREYVIVHGHYLDTCCLPGGHVEPGETEEQTALREVREETGLEVTLIDGFRCVKEHYLVREGRPNDKKTIVYFLAEYSGQTPKTQDPKEVKELLLMDYEAAMECFKFDNFKTTLAAAEKFLNEHNM